MEGPMTVAEAAEYSRRHPITIGNALRSGDLHGGQRKKRGTWSIMPECLDAWLLGEPCAHKKEKAA